jgi:transposase-like protein
MSKLSSIELFAGRHFDREVIILCVRWYLRYKLSFRDLVEMMSERGLSLAHTTIMRRVRRYASEFVKRWNRFGRSCGRSLHRAIRACFFFALKHCILYADINKSEKCADAVGLRQLIPIQAEAPCT